jgi:type IV secretory pathway TrbD component
MTNAAVASDQIRNSVKRAVESYVPLDGTVGPAAKKAQDAIEGVVRFAETGTPDTTTSSSDPASPEPQFEPSAALEPPGPPPLPTALHDPMDPVSARVPAVAGGPTPSGTPFEIRDVSAWREGTGRAVEALAMTADESATALQGLLQTRVTDLKATLWMRVVFTVGFCLVAVVMLRVLTHQTPWRKLSGDRRDRRSHLGYHGADQCLGPECRDPGRRCRGSRTRVLPWWPKRCSGWPIAALVKTIQSDTQDATAAMEESTQRVVEGTSLSDSAGSALIDIVRVSKDLAGLVQSIFVSTQMQTEIAQGVSANMGGILDITEKTTTGAGYIASAMNQLTETAGHLKRSVARFRL